MNNFDTKILSAIVDYVATLSGNPKAAVKPMDSVSNLLRKWSIALEGSPMPSDTRNGLLRKIARSYEVEIFPGDSNIKLLQRLAGQTRLKSTNECLAYILANPLP